MTRPSALTPAEALERIRGHMPGLDGLRGIAILLVLWYHVGLAGGKFDTLPAKVFSAGANAGWTGVQLFFVLSGFLITGILLDSRDRPHAWRNFLARRALRIFPLYYAVLTLGFIVLPAAGVLPVAFRPDYEAQAWYWTYTSNWSEPFYIGGPVFAHLWSLAVEEQFYLLWPFAALALARGRLVRVAIACIVIAIAARLALPHLLQPRIVGERAAYFFTFARWDALAIGALVAMALRNPTWSRQLLARLPALTVASGLAVLALAIYGRGLADSSLGVATVGHTLLAFFFACVIAGTAVASRTATGMMRILRYGPLCATGRYSYAIYVVHLPMAHLLKPLLPSDLATRGGLHLIGTLTLQMGLVFGASLVLAVISWHVLEAPALRLKRHFGGPGHAQAPEGLSSHAAQ